MSDLTEVKAEIAAIEAKLTHAGNEKDTCVFENSDTHMGNLEELGILVQQQKKKNLLSASPGANIFFP